MRVEVFFTEKAKALDEDYTIEDFILNDVSEIFTEIDEGCSQRICFTTYDGACCIHYSEDIAMMKIV